MVSVRSHGFSSTDPPLGACRVQRIEAEPRFKVKGPAEAARASLYRRLACAEALIMSITPQRPLFACLRQVWSEALSTF